MNSGTWECRQMPNFRGNKDFWVDARCRFPRTLHRLTSIYVCYLTLYCHPLVHIVHSSTVPWPGNVTPAYRLVFVYATALWPAEMHDMFACHVSSALGLVHSTRSTDSFWSRSNSRTLMSNMPNSPLKGLFLHFSSFFFHMFRLPYYCILHCSLFIFLHN